MRRMIPALLGLVLVFPVALAAQQQQQEPTLVEAARKAREAKKNAPKPKFVFTNDSIPQTPGAPAAAPAASGGVASVAAAAPPADEKKGLEEADWRKRFAEARSKLATAEKELDLLQRELNLNRQQYYSDPNKTLREEYTRGDINKGKADIDAKKLQVEQLGRALSTLEDELRRAGGPPSWGRP